MNVQIISRNNFQKFIKIIIATAQIAYIITFSHTYVCCTILCYCIYEIVQQWYNLEMVKRYEIYSFAHIHCGMGGVREYAPSHTPHFKRKCLNKFLPSVLIPFYTHGNWASAVTLCGRFGLICIWSTQNGRQSERQRAKKTHCAVVFVAHGDKVSSSSFYFLELFFGAKKNIHTHVNCAKCHRCLRKQQ